MKTLSVCVGSSCHLLGSYEVIKELKQLIERHGLADQIELKASFCLGHCQDGVTVCYDGTVYTALTKEKIGAFFNEYILGNKANDR
ncbi:MAG TPA: (2Fe-2S) ferredoxin domain-containing protein [Firmicutes bacterium]|uniref:(2Fe-2S) ferredoxin domain-containing protein n=1 Tax=Capillibacterium thermochitinicola TaxID=2699427 RepID=A0A8J6LRG3_9FIRM|nr:(2Fe-2S) ferredoxin domain-containing protein [Capillibacterium thermochitinicola]MBA2132062.1 (2Fe-2S) ferredoxin domain-containing protein [Capillibacterium thermochitinicola]HHW11999.1 (2Fe-2S) ferredoxin domain-containing protein [Bacillota bacterium]